MGRPFFIAKITQKCDKVLDNVTQMCYYIIVKRDRDRKENGNEVQQIRNHEESMGTEKR